MVLTFEKNETIITRSVIVFIQIISHVITNTLDCRVVPSPGRCAQAEKRTFWSYSTKIGACTELYGCYGIRDRNVFQSRAFCERSCFTTGNNDATSNSYLGRRSVRKNLIQKFDTKTTFRDQINSIWSHD